MLSFSPSVILSFSLFHSSLIPHPSLHLFHYQFSFLNSHFPLLPLPLFFIFPQSLPSIFFPLILFTCSVSFSFLHFQSFSLLCCLSFPFFFLSLFLHPFSIFPLFFYCFTPFFCISISLLDSPSFSIFLKNLFYAPSLLALFLPFISLSSFVSSTHPFLSHGMCIFCGLPLRLHTLFLHITYKADVMRQHFVAGSDVITQCNFITKRQFGENSSGIYTHST